MKPIHLEPRKERPIEWGDEFTILGLELYKTNDNIPVTVTMPNIISLYLNISEESFKKAWRIYESELLPTVKYINYKAVFDDENSESLVFNLIEELMICIVFSYCAVEATCNTLIPASYKWIDKTSDIRDKLWIERHVPTINKIKKILPEIYKFKFNHKEIHDWNNFKKLEKYRNEIVHKKGEIFSRDGKSKSATFVNEMFFFILQDKIHESSKSIIKYYVKKLGDFPGIPYEFSPTTINAEKYFPHFGLNLDDFDVKS